MDVLSAIKEIKRPQSKIVNKEEESITGDLIMKLQKYDGTNWKDEKEVVNKQVTIPANGLLKLDTGKDSNGNQVFDGFNNLGVKTSSTGKYRVYLKFIVESKNFEKSWDFTVK